MAVFKTGKLAKPHKIIKNQNLPIVNREWIAKLQVVLCPIFSEHNY